MASESRSVSMPMAVSLAGDLDCDPALCFGYNLLTCLTYAERVEWNHGK